MKNLLVGNGLLIEFGGIDYTNKSIVLRTLKNFETPDFPSHVIVNTPIDAKIYFGLMFKEIPSIAGKYNIDPAVVLATVAFNSKCRLLVK